VTAFMALACRCPDRAPDASWSDVGVTTRYHSPVHSRGRLLGARRPAGRGRGRRAPEPRRSPHSARRRASLQRPNVESPRHARSRRRPLPFLIVGTRDVRGWGHPCHVARRFFQVRSAGRRWASPPAAPRRRSQERHNGREVIPGQEDMCRGVAGVGCAQDPAATVPAAMDTRLNFLSPTGS
jgi:hypothetical protein